MQLRHPRGAATSKRRGCCTLPSPPPRNPNSLPISISLLFMADVILRFSLLRPASSPLLPPPVPSRLRLGLSRRLRILAATVPSAHHHSKRFSRLKVRAVVADNEGPKWWEKNAGSNMIDVHSTHEFLNVLSQAGDKLVIVEFYGTWCGSCRALFPKLCRTAEENPDIIFIKVNFDENKPMCKRLNVRVLPYFHFYRGADGLLESFSCSLAKFQKIKDAIAMHNTARCSIGPPVGVGDINLLDSVPQGKPAEPSTSPNILR